MRNSSEHIEVVSSTKLGILDRKSSLSAQSTVVSSIPRHSVTVRLVELPSQDASEIAQMAALASEEMVPFSQDEIVRSSVILEKLDGGKSQVLIAIAHLDVVEQHLARLHEVQLNAKSLFLSTSCISAALSESQPSDASLIHIHLESDSLDILALDESVLRYSRGIELNTTDEPAVIEAMENALRVYSREDGGVNAQSSLHITTAFPVSETFWTHCAERLPAIGFEFNASQVSDTTPLLAQGAKLLASYSSDLAVDLLPTTIKHERARQEVKSGLLRQCALFVVMLGLIAGTFIQAVSQRQGYLNQLDSEIEGLRPTAEAVMQKRAHLQRLQEQVTRTDTPYQHLGRIMAETPPDGLTFSRYAYTHNTGITLQGRADSRERFDGLIDQLRTVGKTIYPQFAQAQTIYDRQRKENALDVWEYAISIDFPKDVNAEGEGL